jgi:hypothetical protein
MAETLGIGTSILGLAQLGVSLVTTLRIYAAAEARINALSSDLAVMNNILTDLGTNISKYKIQFRIQAKLFLDVKEGCEKCFGKLGKALKVVGKEERRGEAEGDAKERMRRNVGPWEKLMFALGGERETKVLLDELEKCKSTLRLVLQLFNWFILSKMYVLRLSMRACTRGSGLQTHLY